MRRLVFLIGVGSLLLVGCSSNSFVGRRVDNFTAYYNAFYNAQASFDEGVRALKPRQETLLDRTRYLDLFPAPGKGNNAPFEKAIVKSADVLREHPESKWADDALLLIGKSYFYTGQYVGAEQKFREIVYTLAEEEGRRSPLEFETRFWLARTLVANEAYDRAQPFLDETLALDDIPRRWRGEYLLVQADLYVQQGAWDEAAVALRDGIEAVRDRDLRARAYFLLGQVEETRGEYAAAAEAYERVERFNPTYDLRYAAELSGIRVGGEHFDAADALEKLRRMERDGKNYEFRNELRYVRGRILQASNRPDEAFRVYDDVLYGGDGDISGLRGRIHYALGTLYRDVYVDYFMAAAHFDTAATALPRPQQSAGSREERLTAEAIQDAPELKATFASFRSAMLAIQEADSLLELGALPPDAFAARIRSIREARARVLADEARELEKLNAQRAFSGGTGQQGAARNVAPQPGAGGAETGFLAFRDPVRVRDNRNAFAEVWGDRPLVDNWRRGASISGTERVELEASLDERASPEGVGATASETVLPQIDLTPIPRTVETQVAMRRRRAEARYQLANVLFLNMNRPDSAAAWYRTVIDEDGEERVAPRAYYALAEVQQALGDTLASEALYRETLQKYPGSDFAGRIRERLGLTEAAVLDSSAVAQAAYERARSQWLAGAYPTAFDSLLALPARYPSTTTAPQALYAAGALFLEWAREDSLDVLETPLPADSERLVEAGLLVPTDTLLALAPDSSALPSLPDSTNLNTTARDSLEAASPVDRLALPRVTVLDLFQHVVEAYRGTPYAQKAQALAATLAEEQAARQATASPPDSTAEGPPAEDAWEAGPPREERPDTLKTDVALPGEIERDVRAPRRQGLEMPTPLEEDTAPSPPADTLAPPAPDRSDPALYGPDPVDAGAGFTLVVGSADTLPDAELIADGYRQQGFRVGVFEGATDEGIVIFRVSVGQFASSPEAHQALLTLHGLVPPDTRVFRQP